MAIEKLSGALDPSLPDRRSSEKIVPEGEAWLPDGVGDALNSEVLPARDELYGWGEAHQYGMTGECLLFLYPDHQTLVYEDPQLYVVVKKPSAITLAGDAVFVDTPGETQTSFLAFNRDGGMNLVVKPRQLALDQLSGGGTNGVVDAELSTPAAEPITETLVSEVTAPWEVEDGVAQLASASGTAGDRPVNLSQVDAGAIPAPVTETPSAVSQITNDRELRGEAAHRSVQDESPASPPEPTKQKAKRIDLKAARLGRPIVCRETKNGKTITKFPVAEHSKQEDGTDVTAWHTVMAFNVLADRLCREFDAGEIGVGDELKVAGYPQQQHIPDRHGELKAHEILFAAHVGKVKKASKQ
jgi:hypothetical protein